MEQQQTTVPVADLSVVNDVLAANIAPTFILIKQVRKESKIIMPDTVGMAGNARAVVVKTGDKVDNIKVDDIVLDLKNEKSGVYYYKKGEDMYMLTDQYNLLMWTTGDNYSDK